MPNIDVSVFGDRQLEKKLHNLVLKTQKKVVKNALRKESTRTKKRIVANIVKQGLVKTGRLLDAYKSAKNKLARSGKNFIRLGVEAPTRAALDISPDDKYYYPYAVEFGHAGAEPKPFIRPAIDEHKPQSIRDIGQDIGKNIEREAKR